MLRVAQEREPRALESPSVGSVESIAFGTPDFVYRFEQELYDVKPVEHDVRLWCTLPDCPLGVLSARMRRRPRGRPARRPWTGATRFLRRVDVRRGARSNAGCRRLPAAARGIDQPRVRRVAW